MIRINLFYIEMKGMLVKCGILASLPGKISPSNVIETRTSIFHNITNIFEIP